MHQRPRCDDLALLQDITSQLLETGHFEEMTPRMDEEEHSIEMHLPFIRKVFIDSGALDICWF